MQKKSTQPKNRNNSNIRFIDKTDEGAGINLIDRTDDQGVEINFIDKESPPPQPASLTSTGESSQSPQGAGSSFHAIQNPAFTADPLTHIVSMLSEQFPALGEMMTSAGLGFADMLPLSPTPVVLSPEDRQAALNGNQDEWYNRIAYKVGGLGSTIVGASTVGNYLTKKLLGKIGLGKVVNFLIGKFGEKMGMAMANGLPLGITMALQNDETLRQAIEDPTFDNISKNLASRIENAIFGEAAGVQYSFIADTFRTWGGRAIANIITTRVVHSVHQMINGEIPEVKVEDLVYDTLMDIWFSKHPGRMTTEQHKQMVDAAQRIADMMSEPTIREIEESLKNNADAIKKTASEAAKKFFAEKELKPFEKKAEEQRIVEGTRDQVTYLTYKEIDAIMQRAGIKDVKEVNNVIQNDKVIADESYYKLTKTIDMLRSVKKELKPKYKRYLYGAEKVKTTIDYNAYKGDKNASVLFDIYDGFYRVMGEDPVVAMTEAHVFDAVAKTLGMKTGDLVKAIDFRIEKSDAKDKKSEASTYAYEDGKVVIQVDAGRTDQPLVGMHELFHVFTRILTDSRVAAKIDPIFQDRRAVEGFRDEINNFFKRYYKHKYKKNWEEPIADEFVAYFATTAKKNPMFKRMANSVLDVLERAYKEFDHSQYRETEPEMLFKMHSFFHRLLGAKRMRALNEDIQKWRVKTGQTRQVTDPNVYVHKVPGASSGTKIINLIRDIKDRHDTLVGVTKRYSENPTPELQKRIQKLQKMQQRDVDALNLLTKYEFTYDPATGDLTPALGLDSRGNAKLAHDMLINNSQVITDPVSYNATKLVSAIAGDNPQEALGIIRSYFEPTANWVGHRQVVSPDALRLFQALPEGNPDVVLVKRLVERIAAGDKAGVDSVLPMLEKSLVDKLQEVNTETERHWIDDYLDDLDSRNNDVLAGVIRRRSVDEIDINPLEEWLETPSFALRRFPEARRQSKLLINSRLAHLYAVNMDVLYFRKVLGGFSKVDYPLLKNAITDAYTLSKEKLVDKYEERIANAAEKMRDYFVGMKHKIRDHYKRVAARYMDASIMDVFEKYQDITDKNKVYEEIRDAVKNGELTEYQAQKVRSLWNKFREIDEWGIWDYVTRIEQGTFKVVDKDGHVRAVRSSLEDAQEAADYLQKTGEVKGTLEIVREFSKTDPLEHRGAVSLKGDPDFMRSLKTYSYLVHKRLIVEPAIWEAQQWMAQADQYVLPPNARKVLENLMDHVKGKYYWEDRVLDNFLKKHDLPDLSATRMVGTVRKLIAYAKLGWRYGAVAVNISNGLLHLHTSTDIRAFKEAARLARTEEGRRIIEQAKPYIAETMIEGESGVFGGRMKLLGPLGAFQLSEKGMREFGVLTNYVYFKRQGLSHEEALQEAIDATQVQFFLYDAAALPRSFRSPAMRLVTQFKAFLVQEFEYFRQLPTAKKVKYITLQLAFGGPQAMLHFLHSLPVLGAMGVLDEIEDYLQSLRIPDSVPVIGGKPLAYGIYGLFGVDVSMAAAAQLPERLEDWLGAFVVDAINIYRTMETVFDSDVKTALGLRQIHDTKSGVQVLLDDLSKHVVVARAWREAIDAAFGADEDGVVWVRDNRGRKLYPVLSRWDVVKLAMGMKPIQRGVIQTKARIWQKAIEKKILKRRAAVDAFVRYWVDGARPPEWLYQELLEYGVSPQSIEQALQNSELSPVERQMRVANYLDKLDAMDRVIDVQEILDAIKNGD